MPKKILYVEDSAEYAELAISAMKKCAPAYEVRLTEDLVEIQALLKGGGFDIVVSDFNLRGFDGRDVLLACKTLAPGLPLILLTGALTDETAVELLKMGAADYILKDRLARLPAAIDAAISERERELALQAAVRGLKESEARYRKLFEASSDLIFLVSMEGEIIDSNPAFQRATGRGKPGAPFLAEQLLPEALRPAFRLVLERAAALQNISPVETTFVPAQGPPLTVQGSFQASEMDGGKRYLQGIFRDITGARCLEEQLRQTQKMEALGRLAGGMAHDFNNMLGAIDGYASLALNPLKEGDPIKDDLGEIRKAVARAAALMTQMLVFSRKQALQKQPCDLNAIVRNAQRAIARMLNDGVRLELDLSPELPGLLADSSQLEQLLLNLVRNSRDAMPDGGDITLRTRLVTLQPGGVRAPRPEEAGRDFILISIKDPGTGMNKAIQEHLFEPFFTTKERGQGAGLGLSAVYGAAKQHNGWVTVNSEPGRGTEFSVYLPVNTSAAPGKAAAHACGQPRRGTAAARILIIEDDPVLRSLSLKALEEHGYCPEKAGSIEEALTILRQRGAEFDLVFSDMVLGDGKIMAVADELARRSPKAGFIFTSGYLEEKANWDFMARMGYKFIPKPFSVETLLRTIAETLNKQPAAPGP